MPVVPAPEMDWEPPKSGRLESEGHFTLNEENAARKLERFRFQEPSEHVLCLIRGAVRGGASYISIDRAKSRYTVSFDGRTLSKDELESMPGQYLLGGPENLVCLAASIQQIRKDFRCRSGAFQAVGDNRGIVVQKLADPINGTIFEIPSYGRRNWLSRIRPFLRRPNRLIAHLISSPVEWLISSRCFLAGVPVLLNGRAVNEYMYGSSAGVQGHLVHLRPYPEVHGARHLVATKNRPGLLPGLSIRHGNAFIWWRGDSLASPEDWSEVNSERMVEEGPFLPNIIVAGAPAAPCLAIAQNILMGATSVAFCRDGVLLERHHPRGLPRGWWCVVSAEELHLDISGKVVRDESYERAMRGLARLLKR